MDAQQFLGLEGTHNPHRWFLPVTEGVSTHGGFLFGGAALGASMLAMELTTGRPAVWATAQYLDYARIGEIADIDVVISVNGHNTAQARAVVHVRDREVITVNAALGARPVADSGQWATRPDVTAPADCPSRENRWEGRSVMDSFEARLARGRQWEEFDGTYGDGHSAIWLNTNGLEMSAATLALFGDYVPFGISQTLGRFARSNSLDNTLRVARLVETEWVLLDVRIHAVDHGFGHGLVHLWAEDGTLLGTASQSAIVRAPKASAGGPGDVPPPVAAAPGDVPPPVAAAAPVEASGPRPAQAPAGDPLPD